MNNETIAQLQIQILSKVLNLISNISYYSLDELEELNHRMDIVSNGFARVV